MGIFDKNEVKNCDFDPIWNTLNQQSYLYLSDKSIGGLR